MNLNDFFLKFISFVLLSFCLSKATAQPISLDPKQIQLETEKIYNSLTLEQKVGQLFILGYRGQELTPNTKKIIKTIQPGGFITFKRNIKSLKQIKKMNLDLKNQLTKYSSLPPLLMVDQEGGSVTRIKTRPVSPSALTLGQVNKPTYTHNIATSIGQLLHSVGFNMNLAPVVDLSDPLSPSFLGNRSFSSSPEVTARHALDFSYGLLKSNILPTYKHFPGHGASQLDSHKTLPIAQTNIQELLAHDLKPYIELSQKNIPSAVMVSHVHFKNIDPKHPTTFSKKLVSDLLVNQLNYQGLVITDDLDMAATLEYGSTGERASMAIKAGNHMIMIAWNIHHQIKAYKHLLKSFRSHKITRQRLEKSVKKIIETKLRLNHSTSSLSSLLASQSQLKTIISDVKKQSTLISKESFLSELQPNLVLNEKHTQNKKLYIFSSDLAFYNSFRQSFNGDWKIKHISLRRKTALKFKSNSNFHSVFYVTGKGSSKLLSSLPKRIKEKTIVINASFPGVVSQPDSYMSVINTSSRNYLAGKWVAQKLNTGTQSSIDRSLSSQF